LVVLISACQGANDRPNHAIGVMIVRRSIVF